MVSNQTSAVIIQYNIQHPTFVSIYFGVDQIMMSGEPKVLGLLDCEPWLYDHK